MVRTFLKVYMELGSYFLFLQEQIKDIIIIITSMRARRPEPRVYCVMFSSCQASRSSTCTTASSNCRKMQA
jgi:hypothetical protein